MKEYDKIKSTLIRVLCAMLLFVGIFLLKFVFEEEQIVQDVCNYLATDIVFLP